MHVGLARFSVARDVARCRDHESISKVCVLKLANVDLGCYNVMECNPLNFFTSCVFMQLSADSETVHHPYISTCFCGKHFCTLVHIY